MKPRFAPGAVYSKIDESSTNVRKGFVTFKTTIYQNANMFEEYKEKKRQFKTFRIAYIKARDVDMDRIEIKIKTTDITVDNIKTYVQKEF